MSNNLDAEYSLTADIDCTGVDFEPVGTIDTRFTGSLDGNGYVITNLTIDQPDTQSAGLFGATSSEVTIQDIGIESGSVTGLRFVGGLVGYNGGTITRSFSHVDATATTDGLNQGSAGSLAGASDGGTITDSYSTGDASSDADVGGLVGYYRGTIARVYATGDVSGGDNMGGLIGRTETTTVTNAFATGDVESGGGLIGALGGGASVSGGYWNNTDGNPDSCYSGGNTGCTAIDDDISYFYDSDNEPLASWSFPETWVVVANALPIFPWQDRTAPTLSTLSPADGGTSVAVDSNLVITFNELIGTAGTGTVSVYRQGDNVLFEQISVTGSLVTGSGTTQITINPSGTLEYNIGYYVQIHPNAFADWSGNSYAGISDTTNWNFVTAVAPVSSSSSSSAATQGGGRRGSVGRGNTPPSPALLSPSIEQKMHNAAQAMEQDPFLLRVCDRVMKWFRGNEKMLGRVNARLQKRFGFICEGGH